MLSQRDALVAQIGPVTVPIEVDRRSFSALYSTCDLNRCQGMCCYDGVYLEAPEVTELERLIAEEKGRFSAWGMTVDLEALVRESARSGRSQVRTKLVPFRYADRARMPSHFESTACVFRCSDGRCSLQRIAMERGLDPWYFKPMGCWMHPLVLELGKPVRLSVGGTEDSRFASCTQCGMRRNSGKTGYDIFRRELEVLSDWLAQDLLTY